MTTIIISKDHKLEIPSEYKSMFRAGEKLEMFFQHDALVFHSPGAKLKLTKQKVARAKPVSIYEVGAENDDDGFRIVPID